METGMELDIILRLAEGKREGIFFNGGPLAEILNTGRYVLFANWISFSCTFRATRQAFSSHTTSLEKEKTCRFARASSSEGEARGRTTFLLRERNSTIFIKPYFVDRFLIITPPTNSWVGD
ncbi:hypothetical protein CEXT_57751 [Caerostris extrusa]|uniref:Uncharacterized protein n=1 Tax=Caerostris extrusa TaxID=172846 RepID=A0AAV4XL56_CAEEX|nr:hypothetical protein CEXT_57751 [Caerostris extrusa]